MLCGWVPELPTLVASQIANEDAFLSVGLQLFSLVLLDVDIGSAAKNAKMSNIWFGLVPELIWGGVVQSGSWRTIMDMYKGSHRIPPKGRW